MTVSSQHGHSPLVTANLKRRAYLSALGLSLAGTAFLGGGLFAWQQNIWWFASGGILSLFGDGFYLGRKSREAEPLHGTVLSILYFATVAAVLFGGELFEVLPDPLPGLAIGDSTFFFVWPLLMLLAAVTGYILGGRATKRHQATAKAKRL